MTSNFQVNGLALGGGGPDLFKRQSGCNGLWLWVGYDSQSAGTGGGGSSQSVVATVPDVHNVSKAL